jgi:L-lactate dehydrogenase (cytochrome)
MNEFVRMLADQVAADVRGLPDTLQRRFSDEGRVGSCRNVAELRALARQRLPRAVFDYVDGGAWDEVTLRRNERDFEAFTIRPRVLVDVPDVDLSTTVLGQPVSLPIVGAPTGLTGLVNQLGELAVARALHAAGAIYTLSIAGSYSVEEVAAAAPGRTWCQVYFWRDRGIVRDFVERARAAGYLALVLTVDVQRAGPRERDSRNGFSMPPRVTLRSALEAVTRPRWTASFVSRPRLFAAQVAGRTGGAPMSQFINEQFEPSVSWAELEWLRDVWQGPLLVKGILRPDDARLVVDAGASGVIVSNHGGRQLDHTPSAIQSLRPIVEEVGGEAEVILDGGIRRGTDILKALGLGARACMVGRALVYGLAGGGYAGTRRAVEILESELRLAMALAGCGSLAAIDETLVGPAWPENLRSPRMPG